VPVSTLQLSWIGTADMQFTVFDAATATHAGGH